MCARIGDLMYLNPPRGCPMCPRICDTLWMDADRGIVVYGVRVSGVRGHGLGLGLRAGGGMLEVLESDFASATTESFAFR